MRESILKSIFGISSGNSNSYCRVKFTHTDDGWKTDKTYEEVMAAYRANAYIEAEVPNDSGVNEVLLIPLRFVNTHGWLTSITFYWERTFVPPGGYGDVTVYSIEAVMQPGSSRLDYSEQKFPACTCGRDPVPV